MALQLAGSGNRENVARLSRLHALAVGQISLLVLAAFCVLGVVNAHASDSSPIVHVNLPAGVVGTTYSGSVWANRGTPPYYFAVVDAALPAGLSLNSKTGAVTGTPTVTGTNSLTLKAIDSTGLVGRLKTQITISSSAGSSIIVTISPTSTSVASGNTQQFAANVQGTSNTAVIWSTTAGKISGSGLFTAPSVSATTTATVTATSSADITKKASAIVSVGPSGSSISVTVSPATTSVASGKNQQFAATVQGSSNTAVTWSATAGTVSSGGLFTAPSVTSSTNVTVTATSAADTTKKASAMVSVSSTAPSLSITTYSLPGAQSGVAYSYQISASGGITPYQWSVAAGSLPQGITLNSSGVLNGTSAQTGQFSFTAQVADGGSSTASMAFSLSVSTVQTGGNYDGPAELPRAYVQSTLADTPAPGTTTPVSSGANLQTALNNANCGDTIELAASATFTGTFTLPAKACDDSHWIIVRTSAPDSSLPAEGSRMLPCYAGVTSLSGRPAFTCPSNQNVLAQVVEPLSRSGPFILAPGANHYRLLGLEITRTAGIGIVYDLISLSSGTADKIYVDRSWLHGTANDETKTGFALGSITNGAIFDSYFSDFHCTAVVGTCTDAQAVGGGNSSTAQGPYKITNNFLEASGENVLFGGGGSLTFPTDIEIRRNHFFKPLIWMKGQPGFVGGAGGNPFMVKNLLELKNAVRVLVEGNIFEYSWGGFSQVGFSILLTPKNQGGHCNICQVTDVTIRYNKISHTGTGISLADSGSDTGAFGTAGERWSLHDITLDDINASLYSGNGGLFQVFNGYPVNPLNNVMINHVTGFPDINAGGGKIMSLGADTSLPPMYGLTFSNNIVGPTKLGIWSTGGLTNCAALDVPVASLNACFQGGYVFTTNAIIGGTSFNYTASQWPTGNFFPSSDTGVQFANYNNGIGGDYTLGSTSPYKNAGTDGKDLGADISAIQAAIAGVY